MFFGTTAENPWKEDADQPAKAAAVPLLDLARFAEQHTPFCKAHGFISLSTTARDLASMVQENREVYTTHRKLFVVRIPELLVALETMVKLPQGTDMVPLQEEIVVAIRELAAITEASIQTSRTKAISKASLGLELSRLGVATPNMESPPPSARGGLLGKMNVGSRLTSAVKTLQGVAGDVSSSSLAVVNYATVLGKHTLLDGVDMVAMPLRARANALTQAIEQTIGVALVGGLLATVLFPPALPLAIGYAYLTAGGSYQDALDENLSQEEQVRQLRKRGANDEVARALANVRGQRVIRLETLYLMAEVDLKTNQIDSTILAGRYAGTRLSGHNLSIVRLLYKTAPDSDTQKLLDSYLSSKT